MNWSVSVLSTATSDTEPTIVVNFESGKYVFNTGEGTGRSWLQSRRHWRKARGVFLTSVGTQRCSGLAGVLMFCADASIQAVKVMGPPGITHYLASMRSYCKRLTMSVKVMEVPSAPPVYAAGNLDEPQPAYTDENIRLYAIPLHAVPASPAEGENTAAVHGKRKRSPSPDSSFKRPAPSDPAAPTTSDEDLEHVPRPLLERIAESGFSPLELSGEDAEEWRRMVVANMFPCSPPAEEPIKKRKQKQKDVTPPVVAEAEPQPVQPQVDPIMYNAAYAHRSRRLPPFAHPDSGPATLCYIVVGPRVRGKFDAARANALGVQGKLRALLTQGQSVSFMVDDGTGNMVERTVMPEEVVGPSEQPHVTMILDVPTPEHIPELVASFTENPFYARFRSKAEEDAKEYHVHAVFHLCGPGVLEDERYKAFMRGFADGVHHLISSREHGADNATFTTAAYSQLRLNQLDPDMFPPHHYSVLPRRDLSLVPGLPPLVELLQHNRLVDVRPPRKPCLDVLAQQYDHFHPAITGSQGVLLPPAVADVFRKSRAKVKQLAAARDTSKKPGDDVEIIPLGTSSTVPSKYRNVSSTLVRIPGWGSLLLDVGEGSWGQLARMYGDDIDSWTSGVWELLRDLKCIFISHMHADHHIGLAKILAMRKLMNPPPSQPLYVVGPRHTLVYLREQSEVEDLGVDQADGNGIITILSDMLNWKPVRPFWKMHKNSEPYVDEERSQQAAKNMCRALGLESFTTVDVSHGTRCYGVVVKHSDGWSIVFSADTSPSDNLVIAGEGATLLIHEASFADDQEEMAEQKAHSTCGQAIDIGQRMDAQNILLTHFSARFPKMLPVKTGPPSGRGRTLALALDHTRVKIGDLWKLDAYLPAIECNFADTVAEEGDGEQEAATVSW
ncbi:hypothetical protein POSPLADRAFT_1045665 [Postia placenta MAD-698-R-SB12]|uniref:ribonuclease Z n=1 Tax=Postia placenta MAD-698-R-SB12 TaxID=670580 RepID=A0A1X6N4D5_9APHY|nr:hypothetical protein POSPLADRAFT_1045665 [Postia placenta MAD-698-R-SB12]OSX63293.1 hypothetical protein POSPLADRAFT_1045665 [Postia placenta MAD-698-R-SB12]